MKHSNTVNQRAVALCAAILCALTAATAHAVPTIDDDMAMFNERIIFHLAGQVTHTDGADPFGPETVSDTMPFISQTPGSFVAAKSQTFEGGLFTEPFAYGEASSLGGATAIAETSIRYNVELSALSAFISRVHDTSVNVHVTSDLTATAMIVADEDLYTSLAGAYAELYLGFVRQARADAFASDLTAPVSFDFGHEIYNGMFPLRHAERLAVEVKIKAETFGGIHGPTRAFANADPSFVIDPDQIIDLDGELFHANEVFELRVSLGIEHIAAPPTMDDDDDTDPTGGSDPASTPEPASAALCLLVTAALLMPRRRAT